MSSNMERVAAMPDASLYVNRDGRRADDCVDSMVERFCPGEQKHKVESDFLLEDTPYRSAKQSRLCGLISNCLKFPSEYAD